MCLAFPMHALTAKATAVSTCLRAEADGRGWSQRHDVGVGRVGGASGRRADCGIDREVQAGALDGVALQRRSLPYWCLAFVEITARPWHSLSTDKPLVPVNMWNRCRLPQA